MRIFHNIGNLIVSLAVMSLLFFFIYFLSDKIVISKESEKSEKIEITVKDSIHFKCVKCNYSNIQYIYVKKEN